MNASYMMRQTLLEAKKGEGKLSFHPLESVLWFQEDLLLFSWHFETGRELEDALTAAPRKVGGTLCLFLATTPAPAAWIESIRPETIAISGTLDEDAYIPLADLGILIREGVLSKQADQIQEIWNLVSIQNRPFVTLSFGMSLDGKIATYTGDSKYISGQPARIKVHQERNRHQAILVGIQTVLLDHPLLNARLVPGARHPKRVVLDSKLRIPETEPMLEGVHARNTIVFTLKSSDPEKIRRLTDRGAIVKTTSGTDRIDLSEMLSELHRLGIDSVLVEGGGTVHFAFLEAGLADKIHAYVSPLLIGGETAKSAVSGQGFATLADSVRLTFTKTRKIGPDLLLEAVPQKSLLRK